MRVGRRPSPDREARDRAFVTAWNAGVASETLEGRFGFTNATSHASDLRHKGFDLVKRLTAGKGGLKRAAEARRELVLSPLVAPAILYDAEGRRIGTMDPVTRQRTFETGG